MLDTENQIRAYKELSNNPITLPYSFEKAKLIESDGESSSVEWMGVIDKEAIYPPEMKDSVTKIVSISASCSTASESGTKLQKTLDHAKTPSDFIPIGIGWDVINKTEDTPPKKLFINDCISDHDNVDAVHLLIKSLDVTTVKKIMGEINALLSAPAGGESGGTSTSVPPEKIQALNNAVNPNYEKSKQLDIKSGVLMDMANKGMESKNNALFAYNNAVTIAVVSSITSGESIMNDVVSSIVPESVLNALRGD